MATSQRITDVQRIGNIFAASGYFTDAREVAQAAVKIMAGEELGIPPVAAMMGINIIKGKVALGGNLIASRIRAHGFDFIHKQFDNSACVLTFLGRKGDPNIGKGMVGSRPVIGESSFTMEDAKTAQVTGNEHYKKNPRNMLFNRAISNGAKWYTPEVFAGAPVYTPEELGAVVDEQGEMIHDAPSSFERGAADARAVAESKITQMRAGVPYAETVSPIVVPVDPDAGLTPEPVTELWSEMKSIASVCFVFARLKAQMVSLMGGPAGEAEYYRILKAHGGAAHANELKQKAARAASWRMWESIQQAESLAVSEADLPADYRESGEGE